MMEQKTYNPLFLIIGVFIIVIPFWNRFIRVRLPKEFSDFMLEVILLIILTSFILLVLNIKALFKQKKISIIGHLIIKLQENYYINKGLNLVHIISNSPQNVLTFLNKTHFVKKKGKQISYLTELLPYYLLSSLKNISKAIIYIPLNSIPKILVACIFIIDVFYYKHMQYFYYSMLLLGLPTFTNCLRFIIADNAKSTLQYLNAHLYFTINRKTEDYQVKFRNEIPNIEDAKDIVTHQGNKELLEWFVLNFERYSDIIDFLDDIKKEEEFYKPYENIFVYSCYLIGWLYILLC